MRRRAYWFAMLACAACGDGGEAPAASAEVIDSAGVRTVTSAPGDIVYAEVEEEPVLSLGALDGPEEFLFARIASVARDAEGNLVVADNGAGEIRIFGTGGGHLRSFGGRGEGPGEFQALVGAWPSTGGRIVAADRQLGRITQFDATGALTGTATLSGVGEMSILTPVGLAGPEIFLSQIRILAMPSGVESPVQALEEAFEADKGPPEYFLRYRLDGRACRHLDAASGPEDVGLDIGERQRDGHSTPEGSLLPGTFRHRIRTRGRGHRGRGIRSQLLRPSGCAEPYRAPRRSADHPHGRAPGDVCPQFRQPVRARRSVDSRDDRDVRGPPDAGIGSPRTPIFASPIPESSGRDGTASAGPPCCAGTSSEPDGGYLGRVAIPVSFQNRGGQPGAARRCFPRRTRCAARGGARP